MRLASTPVCALSGSSRILSICTAPPTATNAQDTPLRRRLERRLVRWSACAWVASWSGVIKYHGPKPVPAPNRVWVANHSSMIDYTILTAYMPFAAIMQLQPGWVEFLQRRILTCLGCLMFHRTEVRSGGSVRRSPPESMLHINKASQPSSVPMRMCMCDMIEHHGRPGTENRTCGAESGASGSIA